MMGTIWPDGKPLLAQPYKLKQAFAIISQVEHKAKDRPRAS
jgi:hypothetical protein